MSVEVTSPFDVMVIVVKEGSEDISLKKSGRTPFNCDFNIQLLGIAGAIRERSLVALVYRVKIKKKSIIHCDCNLIMINR
jgi:hypothetical protein